MRLEVLKTIKAKCVTPSRASKYRQLERINIGIFCRKSTKGPRLAHPRFAIDELQHKLRIGHEVFYKKGPVASMSVAFRTRIDLVVNT